MTDTYRIQFSHGSTTLNSEQYTVVTADPYQHQRILASAGSGKTTTIAARIAWLLTNTRCTADQIVLLTFSRNAAREMNHRVRALVGSVSLWAGTFHALANTVLKQFDTANQSSFFFIDELPIKWMAWMRTEKGRKWVGKLRYIVVDEFQDINAIQWRLLETMRHIGARMIIVGDDAQNIYTWRGSSTGFLLDFHRHINPLADYQLRQNYRSTESLVTVANCVMRGIPTLPWKEHMIAHKKGGTKPDVFFFWRANDEYTWLAKTIYELRKKSPDATIAVLARNNVDLYRVEECFIQQGVRTRFLVHEDAHNDTALQQGSVDLATFHGSKGLEWDYTFLVCLSDDVLPSKKDANSIIGERRLFYVAVTRARKHMCLTYHGNERSLSRFVREIGYQHLIYHGLAKYALSDFEVGGASPTLSALLDCLDGDEWQQIRSLRLLPWDELVPQTPLKERRLFPTGESWRIPSWADSKDFEAFLRLWVKRCSLQLRSWSESYKDPARERMIFTIRVFQEDIPVWETYKEEFDLMVRYFFADTQRMQPVEYGDIETWSKERGLGWNQQQLVEVTSLLAKLRGQIRPLRFESYNIDEFKIGPTRCVVPSEYRIDCLRSWRRFIRSDIGWRDCLLDTWRLACLEQVAEGRHAGLYRASTMVDNLVELLPFLERLELILQDILQNESTELVVNPEVLPEGLLPVGSDLLLGRTLVRICGEKKPDMRMWTESCLTAYLFTACGYCRPIEQIHILHPFYGILWSFDQVHLEKSKKLYETLLQFWNKKQT